MEPEIIDISTFDIPSTSLGGNGSANFGGGIELLMNDKQNKSTKDDIGLGDLEQLESDLNDMSGMNEGGGDDGGVSRNTIFTEPLPDTFNIGASGGGDDTTKPSVRFGDGESESANPTTSTWDGFNKFNEIPVSPGHASATAAPTQSREEILREKFQLLRKLESLETKGVQLSKKYSMDSPLLEMKGEYETIVDEKAKQNSIKFQGNMLMTCINGIEFLNNRFDPFDVKLDGWSEQVAENVDDYDEVFAELYDKYKSKATMSPELRLLFQLGGSAMMLHMTNSMFKSAMPGMDDVLRQNPDLAQQFQKAAMDSMGSSNPGFSGFMNNMAAPPSTSGKMGADLRSPGAGPPPPLATQGPNAVPSPHGRPGNNNSFASAPDVMKSGRPMARSDGINITENFSSAMAPERSGLTPSSASYGGIGVSTAPRAEMTGPSDIDHLLSGLKTKKINMTVPSSAPVATDNAPESSTISISDLKDMQAAGASGAEPKRSRRRKTSEKNTVSLDM